MEDLKHKQAHDSNLPPWWQSEEKQGVIDKLKIFFEKYFGIGGFASFTEPSHKVIAYNFDRQETLPMEADPKTPYGEKFCSAIDSDVTVPIK